MRDTLSEWLYYRFVHEGANKQAALLAWRQLSVEDKQYWEHEAAAVRRAVERGGFKEQS